MAARKMTVMTEIGIFSVILPVVIGLGVFLMTFSEAPTGRPPDYKTRSLIIAIPMLAACGITFISGTLLLVFRKAWAIVSCVVGGALIALVYLAVMTLLTGSPGLNLLTAVMIAIPILLVVRAGKAFDEMPTPPPPPPQ